MSALAHRRANPSPRPRALALLAAACAGVLLVLAPAASPAATRPPPTPGAGPAAPLAIASAVSGFSLTPTDLRGAYGLPKTGAPDQTIAIISAYDAPSAESDLSAYSKRFGIPPCTTANRCFRKLNQNGASAPLPIRDPSGAVFLTESSVGSEVARGVCQSCSIMLVEANSASKFDVSTAVSAATRAGATVVVTAFEEGEAPDDASVYGATYQQPRTVVVAAGGDSGPTTGLVFFPASLPGVIAVGGTQLDLTAGGRYRAETAWPTTTSGCSMYSGAAAWQKALAAKAGCGPKRAIVDVAAVAQPGALVHVKDAGAPCGSSFCEADGTSVSAPIIAGMIGLAGGAGSAELPRLYYRAHSTPGAFHDITGATSGVHCAHAALCRARPGYDGPTGVGTPNGLSAFLAAGGALDRHHPALALSAPRNRLSLGPGWSTTVILANGNPVAVTGTITVTGKLRVRGAAHTITLATGRLDLAPQSSSTRSLTIATGARQPLSQVRSAVSTVRVKLRGPVGPSLTLTRHLRFYAP